MWTMRSETDRFAGSSSEDGNTLSGHWERLGEGPGRQPWMDITLTRRAG